MFHSLCKNCSLTYLDRGISDVKSVYVYCCLFRSIVLINRFKMIPNNLSEIFDLGLVRFNKSLLLQHLKMLYAGKNAFLNTSLLIRNIRKRDIILNLCLDCIESFKICSQQPSHFSGIYRSILQFMASF